MTHSIYKETSEGFVRITPNATQEMFQSYLDDYKKNKWCSKKISLIKSKDHFISK